MIKNIYCIGRNYREHAKELGNNIEAEPVVFSKPSTSIIDSNTIVLPKFSQEIHFETELVLKISKRCYNITEDNAADYFHEIAIGLDLTARDLQAKLKHKGLPWLLSKGFKGSCYVSDFIDKTTLPDTITFQMKLNDHQVQVGQTKDMIFNFSKIISFISTYIELAAGDIIFTGTPAGVGKLFTGDNITLLIENKIISELQVL